LSGKVEAQNNNMGSGPNHIIVRKRKGEGPLEEKKNGMEIGGGRWKQNIN